MTGAWFSGPLLARIDMIIEVPAVDFESLSGGTPGEDSASVKARVDEMYAGGRVAAMSDGELDDLVRDADAARYARFVKISERRR